MAPPRRSFKNASPIVAPPSVIGVDPAQPARKRNAMSIPRELLTAQAIVKMQKKRFEKM